jgi:Pentapeptide repeats (8 copies)
MSSSDAIQGWREHELDLRVQEVDATVKASDAAVSAAKLQKRTTILQVLAVMAGLLASAAAAFAAYQAGAAVRAAEKGTEQQSADNQLSIAISAIGGGSAAERVAGMTLLDLNVRSRISSATSALDRQKAFGEYVTAIDVLANYIRSASPPAAEAAVSVPAPASFGLGYGYPPAGQGSPFDVVYAADELRDLLGLKDQVMALQIGRTVGIDLSRDELFGLSWTGVSFGWLDAYLFKIDLRGANLAGSSFAGSDLVGAFLQCANLSGADLSGANLAYADLRGANVAGASFRNANLTHAKLTGVFGTAKGLSPGLSETAWNSDPQTCEINKQYWHRSLG